MLYCDQILHTYIFYHCLDTGLQNGDEASLSISPAGRGQLVKMLITLEPHDIFLSNIAHFYILTLSGHWYAKR